MRCWVVLVLACVATAAAHGAQAGTFLGRRDVLSNAVTMAALEEERAGWRQSLRLKVDAGISIQATPEQPSSSSEVITVTWSGVSDPSIGDAIGIYCPYDGEIADFIDYQWANQSSTWKSGEGSFQFPLCNLRCNFTFAFVSWTTQTVLAMSNDVVFAPWQPTFGHIALTGNDDEMRVMWVSTSESTPTVMWGTTPGSYPNQAAGNTSTFTADMMCGAPANVTGVTTFRDPGFLHDVLLTGLEAGTTYYYVYGDENAWAPEHNFTTVSGTGPAVVSQFITYGDMGVNVGDSVFTGANPTAALADSLITGLTNLVFHVGDISYALGHSFFWDQFGNMIEPVATRLPYMVGVGNHEYDHESGGENDPSHAPGNGFHPWWGNYGDDSGGECGVPVFHRYHMPAEASGGNAVFWYSFVQGSIHYIMFSTEHDFTAGSPQHTWLEQTLASVDRSVTPWLVVGGHRPMYFTEFSPAQELVAIGLQEALEDMFMQYKVDLCLWGHMHMYERTCPMYKHECTDGGITHAVVGSGGFDPDQGFFVPRPWSLFHREALGVARVTAYNSTAMHLEWFATDSGAVADQVWIKHE